jgi:hypothetical protein
MKAFFLFLGGFFSSIFALTALGSSSFVGVAILYSTLLYILFYADETQSLVFIAGSTLGLELLGNQHFGIATGLACCCWGLYLFFGQQLRFTSLYARYIVALLLMLTAYNLLFFSLAGFFHRLSILAVVAVIVILVGLYRAATAPGPAYELI